MRVFRLIFLSLIFSLRLLAVHYILFASPEKPIKNYESIVSNLKTGDTIQFSDGASFTVQGILGKGNTTLILDIGKGEALRIPLGSGKARIPGWLRLAPGFLLPTYGEVLDEYYQAARELGAEGVPIPRVSELGHLQGEYVRVEKLNIRFTLNDWLRDQKLTKRDGEFQEFLMFVASTWPYRGILDASSLNIVYTDRGWVLLDYANVLLPARGAEVPSIFGGSKPERTILSASVMKRFSPEQQTQILKAVYGERLKNLGRCAFASKRIVFFDKLKFWALDSLVPN